MCQWVWRLLLLPLIYIQPYCNFLSLEIFWSGIRLEHFSPDFCVAFFSFNIPIYIFRSGKAFQLLTLKLPFTVFFIVQMTSILWPNCYLRRVSPLFIPQIGVILLPFFALAIWGLSTSLSIWLSKLDLHHHGWWISFLHLGQRDNSSPWWHSLVSLMYVLVFWELDNQMRLPHMSFWPRLLLSLLHFSY